MGAQGTQGDMGDQGDQGDAGPTGPTGPAGSGSGFDIHDDLSTQLTGPADLDRLAASDESDSGDPMKWMSLLTLRNWVTRPTVTQTEAEAGTVTSTRMWTPQRVFQAIDARAVRKNGLNEVRVLTQTQYDAISSPTSTTLYVISG